jgi:hypothetical protein
MAYDEDVAARIRALLAGEPGLTEQRMFGGLGFLVNGNMAVAASSKGGVMVRVDPGAGCRVGRRRGVAPMEMRGRLMAGWLHADPSAFTTEAELARLVEAGVSFARSLPPKSSA